MRFSVFFALVVACTTQMGNCQSSYESTWIPTVPRGAPAADELPSVPTKAPARQYDKFNQPGFVRPAQHASPAPPVSVPPVEPFHTVASPPTEVFTVEDYQRSFQPNYIPASANDLQQDRRLVSEEVLPSWMEDDREKPAAVPATDRVVDGASTSLSPRDPRIQVLERAPVPGHATTPSIVSEPSDVNSRSASNLLEPARTEAPSAGVLEASPPPVEAAETRHAFSLSTLLLFGSIGLNIYLIWISLDTYYRYQDLVSDIRSTPSPRRRREARRRTGEFVESAAN